jgi:predicted acylesterase/phospholipase RssA
MEIPNEIPIEIKEKPPVRHIVLSGGGTVGFSSYGLLKETNRLGIWKLENIKTIYATSAGAMIGVIISLGYEWGTLDDYLIKRPWQNVFKMNMYSLIDSFHKRGIFNIKTFEDAFLPLFLGKDISIDITMKEFYELTQIELHFFATEMMEYKYVDMSYITHPDWRVIDVVYCSSALPIIFSPILKDDKCYCDGGLINNYPIEACLEKTNINSDEVMGIRKKCFKIEKASINDSSSLLEYIMIILNHFSKKFMHMNDHDNKCIHNEYIIEAEVTTILNIFSLISNTEERVKLIQLGIDLVGCDISPTC